MSIVHTLGNMNATVADPFYTYKRTLHLVQHVLPRKRTTENAAAVDDLLHALNHFLTVHRDEMQRILNEQIWTFWCPTHEIGHRFVKLVAHDMTMMFSLVATETVPEVLVPEKWDRYDWRIFRSFILDDLRPLFFQLDQVHQKSYPMHLTATQIQFLRSL